MTPSELFATPNALAPHYSRFRVSERLLLTGHSHQAWPDCSFDGQQEAWADAALHVDRKWERASEKADLVRARWSGLLGDPSGHVALTTNTHEGVIRFLSALPLRARPRLVTTDGEFHTIRRQLDRLSEEDTEVVKVAGVPVDGLAERLIATIDKGTAAVLVSSVLYRNAHIVPDLGSVMKACQRFGAELLVDVYHQLNAVPFSLRQLGLEDAFVVGGGYKYMQYGEGNCFLRFPSGRALRPVLTGWFAEFGGLADAGESGRVSYADGPDRFAGATFDPTSHYRAVEVVRFFEGHALTPDLLREVSQHQVGLLAKAFDALELDPELVSRDRSVGLEGVGGFLAFESRRAPELHEGLAARGVRTDYRHTTLRLGPAPYLSDDQLEAAIAALGEVAGSMRG